MWKFLQKVEVTLHCDLIKWLPDSVQDRKGSAVRTFKSASVGTPGEPLSEGAGAGAGGEGGEVRGGVVRTDWG